MSEPEYGPLWEDEYSAALDDIEVPAELNGHHKLERDDLPHNSWQRINLNDPKYKVPPDPPTILGLLYDGKRHVVSGPPESTKTLVVYICALKAIRGGKRVALIDFEMGPHAAAILLTELGATDEEIDSIYCVTPNEPPGEELQKLIDWGADLVIIDAAVSAYDASHLDDNGRKDAEIFARTWIRPLWKAGVTTILLDHVTKDAETRGKFTIGSERKVGQADVHLGMEAMKSLSRGGSGLIKVHVHKDRPGFLKRPIHTVFELNSDTNTHMITWNMRDAHPEDEETGEFRPTVIMEKVSRLLEKTDEAMSRNQIEKALGGKGEYVRQALDMLTKEEYVREDKGAYNARLVTPRKPYREVTDPHLVPSSSLVRPDEGVSVRPFVPPPTGGTGRGRSEDTASSSSQSFADDPDIQAQLYGEDLA